MLTSLIRRFKENDKSLKQEAVGISSRTADHTTNWRALIFWVFVIVAGGLIYFLLQ
jgi:hypothetical protein